MNEARRKFYSDFIVENDSNQSNLFSATNRLLNQGHEVPFPPTSDKPSRYLLSHQTHKPHGKERFVNFVKFDFIKFFERSFFNKTGFRLHELLVENCVN